jgi:hypothetical protein
MTVTTSSDLTAARRPARRPVTQLGLHHAMAVPAVLCAAIVALAAVMPRSDSDLADA